MAKIRKDLFGSVLVENPKGGEPLVLLAGDEVPEGVVVGDHVLEKKGGKSDGEAKAAKKAAKRAATGSASTDAGNGGSEAQAAGEVTVPPQSGRGSGDQAWRDYAAAATAKAGLSIEIAPDAKRGDIVEALKAAGIPVE